MIFFYYPVLWPRVYIIRGQRNLHLSDLKEYYYYKINNCDNDE